MRGSTNGARRARSTIAGWMPAWVIVAVGLTTCGGTPRDTLDDAATTVRVKTALLNHPEIGALGIDVETVRGIVMLSGRIQTEAQAQTAIALARRVPDVREVRSALLIVPDGPPRGP